MKTLQINPGTDGSVFFAINAGTQQAPDRINGEGRGRAQSRAQDEGIRLLLPEPRVTLWCPLSESLSATFRPPVML